MDMAIGMKALGCLVGETVIQKPPWSVRHHSNNANNFT
jgi:hypothetical protein